MDDYIDAWYYGIQQWENKYECKEIMIFKDDNNLFANDMSDDFQLYNIKYMNIHGDLVRVDYYDENQKLIRIINIL